ncbi:hypothetical protein RND81_14G230500 [Saponaria officinalis]|uniref:Retrotransposon gag domain-containing protein n=1 Tax=Saponaria officinalis TaxID=3572 RepID=A0AAW1GTL4_SAPOF
MKMPTVQFGGMTNPDEHLETYESHMFMYDPDDAVWCKVFLTTLTSSAQSWFRSLPTGSIGSYKDLSKRFTEQYAGNRRREKSSAELFTLRQEPGEGLREFLKRFDLESQRMKSLNATMAVFALTHSLADGPLKSNLMKNPPATLCNARARVGGYIREEEYQKAFKTKEDSRPTQESLHPRPRDGRKSAGDRMGHHQKGTPRRRRDAFDKYTTLNQSQAKVFEMTKDTTDYKRPRAIKPHGDRNKHCNYHQDIGHDTEECHSLKNEIEALIRKGRLSPFVKRETATTTENGTE